MAPESQKRIFTFSSTEIYKLFGPEAAEDEEPKRLREYYFKSSIYADVKAKLPLRVLVGHKGIGKSALFKVAMLEDSDEGELPILIRPDDIAGLASDGNDFLLTIRAWREGLNRIITSKVLAAFGLDQSGSTAVAQNIGGRLLSFVADTIKTIRGVELSLDPAKRKMLEAFLSKNQVTVYIDDLDRGWEGRREDVRRISALLNAVRDMTNDNPGLRFKIGLRSDRRVSIVLRRRHEIV